MDGAGGAYCVVGGVNARDRVVALVDAVNVLAIGGLDQSHGVSAYRHLSSNSVAVDADDAYCGNAGHAHVNVRGLGRSDEIRCGARGQEGGGHRGALAGSRVAGDRIVALVGGVDAARSRAAEKNRVNRIVADNLRTETGVAGNI